MCGRHGRTLFCLFFEPGGPPAQRSLAALLPAFGEAGWEGGTLNVTLPFTGKLTQDGSLELPVNPPPPTPPSPALYVPTLYLTLTICRVSAKNPIRLI